MDDVAPQLNASNRAVRLTDDGETPLGYFDEPLILESDSEAALGTLNRRFYLILAIALLQFVIIYFAMPLFALGSALLIAIVLVAYLFFRVLWIRASKEPIMVMRPDVLEIHDAMIDIAIPWEELLEPRVITLVETQLGIEMVDPKATLKRGSASTQMVGNLNLLGQHGDYRLFASPLLISDGQLPYSAQEVADEINVRRAYALKRAEAAKPLAIPPPDGE